MAQKTRRRKDVPCSEGNRARRSDALEQHLRLAAAVVVLATALLRMAELLLEALRQN